LNREAKRKQMAFLHRNKEFQLLHGSPTREKLLESGKPDPNLSGSNVTGLGDGAFYVTNKGYLAKSYGELSNIELAKNIKIIDEKHLPKPTLEELNGGIAKSKMRQNRIAVERGFDAVVEHDIGNITIQGIQPSRNFTLRVLNPNKVIKITKVN
jgi:hypothetical protein